MMKTIFIEAYTKENLGDDLFVKVLCDRYPDDKFILATLKTYSIPFESINNLDVKYIPRYIDGIMSKLKSSFRISSYIKNKLSKKSDGTVVIGGSIFIEPNNWQKHVEKNNALQNNSNNFFILGSNFGPYYTEYFKDSYREIFSKANDVCFRDQSSYKKFNELATVRTAPDVVFSMNTENIGQFSNEKYIVISVIDLSWRPDLKAYREAYENSIIQLSESIIKEGYKVILMSFCKFEGDEEAIERIIHKVDYEELTHYYYRGDMNESLEVINGAAGIVATRFHSMILGWIFNKPVLPIIYSHKMTNVLNDINYDGHFLEIKNIEKFDLKKALYQTIRSQQLDVSEEIRKSHENFLKLDEFMI